MARGTCLLNPNINGEALKIHRQLYCTWNVSYTVSAMSADTLRLNIWEKNNIKFHKKAICFLN